MRLKLDKKPESTWYPPGDLPSPKTHVVVTYEVSFDQIHQWGHKTEFSFGDSPELRERHGGPDSLIARYESFGEELEKLLETDLVEVVKKR